MREERRVHRHVIRPLLELQPPDPPAAVMALHVAEQVVDLRPQLGVWVELDFAL